MAQGVEGVAQHIGALVGHQVALAVELELAVAGVGGLAIGGGDLEKTATVDRHIQAVAGDVDAALGELLRHRCHRHPNALPNISAATARR